MTDNDDDCNDDGTLWKRRKRNSEFSDKMKRKQKLSVVRVFAARCVAVIGRRHQRRCTRKRLRIQFFVHVENILYMWNMFCFTNCRTKKQKREWYCRLPSVDGAEKYKNKNFFGLLKFTERKTLWLSFSCHTLSVCVARFAVYFRPRRFQMHKVQLVLFRCYKYKMCHVPTSLQTHSVWWLQQRKKWAWKRRANERTCNRIEYSNKWANKIKCFCVLLEHATPQKSNEK